METQEREKIVFVSKDKEFLSHHTSFVNARSISPTPNADECVPTNLVKTPPVQLRHKYERLQEAVRRREQRKAVVSTPLLDNVSESDSVVNEVADSSDYRESGLKKLKSGSFESIARWEKENEFLFAIIEDESDWLTRLFPDDPVEPEHFFDNLEDGVILCKLSRLCQKYAEEFAASNGKRITSFPIMIHPRKRCKGRLGKFMRRENVELFLKWCRHHGIHESLLFESNDVVEKTEDESLRENAREIVLCLMEVARMGVKWGVSPPRLVELEREIELEEQMDTSSLDGSISPTSTVDSRDSGVDEFSFHSSSIDRSDSNQQTQELEGESSNDSIDGKDNTDGTKDSFLSEKYLTFSELNLKPIEKEFDIDIDGALTSANDEPSGSSLANVRTNQNIDILSKPANKNVHVLYDTNNKNEKERMRVTNEKLGIHLKPANQNMNVLFTPTGKSEEEMLTSYKSEQTSAIMDEGRDKDAGNNKDGNKDETAKPKRHMPAHMRAKLEDLDDQNLPKAAPCIERYAEKNAYQSPRKRSENDEKSSPTKNQRRRLSSGSNKQTSFDDQGTKGRISLADRAKRYSLDDRARRKSLDENKTKQSDADEKTKRKRRKSNSHVKTELHEKVTKLIETYNIEKVLRLREGKYVILGKIMFVRLLNDHCIVRIGGGWDTLEHYLLTHSIPGKVPSDNFETTENEIKETKTDSLPSSAKRKGRRKSTNLLNSKNKFFTKSTPNLLNIGNSPVSSSGELSDRETRSRSPSPSRIRDPIYRTQLAQKRDERKISQAILRVQADVQSVGSLKKAASLDWTHLRDKEENLRTFKALQTIPKRKLNLIKKMADIVVEPKQLDEESMTQENNEGFDSTDLPEINNVPPTPIEKISNPLDDFENQQIDTDHVNSTVPIETKTHEVLVDKDGSKKEIVTASKTAKKGQKTKTTVTKVTTKTTTNKIVSKTSKPLSATGKTTTTKTVNKTNGSIMNSKSKSLPSSKTASTMKSSLAKTTVKKTTTTATKTNSSTNGTPKTTSDATKKTGKPVSTSASSATKKSTSVAKSTLGLTSRTKPSSAPAKTTTGVKTTTKPTTTPGSAVSKSTSKATPKTTKSTISKTPTKPTTTTSKATSATKTTPTTNKTTRTTPKTTVNKTPTSATTKTATKTDTKSKGLIKKTPTTTTTTTTKSLTKTTKPTSTVSKTTKTTGTTAKTSKPSSATTSKSTSSATKVKSTKPSTAPSKTSSKAGLQKKNSTEKEGKKIKKKEKTVDDGAKVANENIVTIPSSSAVEEHLKSPEEEVAPPITSPTGTDSPKGDLGTPLGQTVPTGADFSDVTELESNTPSENISLDNSLIINNETDNRNEQNEIENNKIDIQSEQQSEDNAIVNTESHQQQVNEVEESETNELEFTNVLGNEVETAVMLHQEEEAERNDSEEISTHTDNANVTDQSEPEIISDTVMLANDEKSAQKAVEDEEEIVELIEQQEESAPIKDDETAPYGNHSALSEDAVTADDDSPQLENKPEIDLDAPCQSEMSSSSVPIESHQESETHQEVDKEQDEITDSFGRTEPLESKPPHHMPNNDFDLYCVTPLDRGQIFSDNEDIQSDSEPQQSQPSASVNLELSSDKPAGEEELEDSTPLSDAATCGTEHRLSQHLSPMSPMDESETFADDNESNEQDEGGRIGRLGFANEANLILDGNLQQNYDDISKELELDEKENVKEDDTIGELGAEVIANECLDENIVTDSLTDDAIVADENVTDKMALDGNLEAENPVNDDNTVDDSVIESANGDVLVESESNLFVDDGEDDVEKILDENFEENNADNVVEDQEKLDQVNADKDDADDRVLEESNATETVIGGENLNTITDESVDETVGDVERDTEVEVITNQHVEDDSTEIKMKMVDQAVEETQYEEQQEDIGGVEDEMPAEQIANTQQEDSFSMPMQQPMEAWSTTTNDEVTDPFEQSTEDGRTRQDTPFVQDSDDANNGTVYSQMKFENKQEPLFEKRDLPAESDANDCSYTTQESMLAHYDSTSTYTPGHMSTHDFDSEPTSPFSPQFDDIKENVFADGNENNNNDLMPAEPQGVVDSFKEEEEVSTELKENVVESSNDQTTNDEGMLFSSVGDFNHGNQNIEVSHFQENNNKSDDEIVQVIETYSENFEVHHHHDEEEKHIITTTTTTETNLNAVNNGTILMGEFDNDQQEDADSDISEEQDSPNHHVTMKQSIHAMETTTTTTSSTTTTNEVEFQQHESTIDEFCSNSGDVQTNDPLVEEFSY